MASARASAGAIAARRTSRSPTALLFSQIDFIDPISSAPTSGFSAAAANTRLTFGQRLTSPDARADGEIVAAQIIPGATRLVRVSRDGKRVTPLTTGSYDEQWTEPRWSHAGDRIVASRWLRGNISQIVVVDTTGRIVHTVSSGTSIEATPSWLATTRAFSTAPIEPERADLRSSDSRTRAPLPARTFRLSDVVDGPVRADAGAAGNRAAAVLFRADGYHLGVGDCCAPG